MGETQTGSKEIARIEAFSDGVFAIAITLLVLEIKVPHLSEGRLGIGLLHLWPSFAGFLTSFLFILIMWMNHHRLFRLVRRSDDWLLASNGLLLLVVTFIPFPTAVLAEHLQGPDAKTAALFYSGTFFVLAIVYNLLWQTISFRNRLVDPERDGPHVAAINRQFICGPIFYGLTMLLAFLSVYACLIASFLLALFFAFPGSAISKAARR